MTALVLIYTGPTFLIVTQTLEDEEREEAGGIQEKGEHRRHHMTGGAKANKGRHMGIKRGCTPNISKCKTQRRRQELVQHQTTTMLL